MTEKKEANTIFHVKRDNLRDLDDVLMSVEAVKVPGGVLYITVHYDWHTINTTFVKSENIIKEVKAGDPEKIWEFLGPKEEKKDECSQ